MLLNTCLGILCLLNLINIIIISRIDIDSTTIAEANKIFGGRSEAEYFVGVLGVGGLIFLGHILYNKYKIKKFRLGKDEKITPAEQKIIGIFLKIAELL